MSYRSLSAFALTAAALAGCGGDDPVFVDASVDATRSDATSCEGLDLGACRAAGCVVDLCPTCTCEQQYRGCLPAGTAPAACPDLACPIALDCCRASGDCDDNGASCQQPGEETCGGQCNPEPDSCDEDRECQVAGGGPLWICEPLPCACEAGAKVCTEGCDADGDCDEGETCNRGNSRCEPIACGPSTECPPDFDCVGGGCQRRACTSDAACDGFCVDGHCFGELGVCQLPRP